MCRTTEAIRANHDDVEENGWDGPMPSRPALADDAARRSLARSVMAHEDRAALLATVDHLRDALKAIEGGIPGPRLHAFDTLNPSP